MRGAGSWFTMQKLPSRQAEKDIDGAAVANGGDANCGIVVEDEEGLEVRVRRVCVAVNAHSRHD